MVNNLKVEFFDRSVDPNSGDTINTWSWDFGDPNRQDDVSNEQNPSYTYDTTGTYTVQLTVGDASKAEGTTTQD